MNCRRYCHRCSSSRRRRGGVVPGAAFVSESVGMTTVMMTILTMMMMLQRETSSIAVTAASIVGGGNNTSSTSTSTTHTADNNELPLPLLQYVFTNDDDDDQPCASSSSSSFSMTGTDDVLIFPNQGILGRGINHYGDDDDDDDDPTTTTRRRRRPRKKYDLIGHRNTTRCGKAMMGVEIIPRDDIIINNSNNDKEVVDHLIYNSPLSMDEPIGSIINDLLGEDGVGFNGVAFTMWIRPTAPPSAADGGTDDSVDASTSDGTSSVSQRRTPIMTIGRKKSTSTDTYTDDDDEVYAGYYPLNYCDSHSIDFQLSIDDKTKQLEMIYRTNDPYFVPCQQMVTNYDDAPIVINSNNSNVNSSNNPASSTMHLAIVLQNGRQEIFINGKRIALTYEPLANDLSHWNVQNSSILFFSTTSSSSQKIELGNSSSSNPRRWWGWNGQIYQFSLYNNAESWSQHNVLNEIAKGLPPSKPYSIDTTVIVEEDVQTRIDTHYIFVDREIEQIQDYWGLPHRPVPKVELFIKSFPMKGNLFYEDTSSGREQSLTSPTQPTTTTTTTATTMTKVPVEDSLLFMSRPDEHSWPEGSVYTSFDVCVMAKTRTRFLLSDQFQCDAATISIIVTPVHDPPVAIGPSQNYYNVGEGLHEERHAIRLAGKDVDRDDYVERIQIVKPPTLGFLYVSVSSYRQDGLSHGTLLSSINNTVPGPVAFVEYRFNGYDEEAVISDSTTDDFHFRVQDRHGLWSDVEEVRLNVQSQVSSFSTMSNIDTFGTSHDTDTILLFGRDESGYNRSLGVYFGSPSHPGQLLDITNTPIQLDTVLRLEERVDHLSAIGRLRFVADNEICDDLSASDVSFPYHVVAMDDDGEIVSVSEIENKQFTYECPTTPINLTAENLVYIVPAVTSPNDDICSGYVFNFTNSNNTEACQNDILLLRVDVDGEKFHDGDALVSIVSRNNAQLTLDEGEGLTEHYTDYIDPLYDQVQMRSSIVVLADVGKLDPILSKIHYQNMVIGKDQVEVTVRYGTECNLNRTQLVLDGANHAFDTNRTNDDNSTMYATMYDGNCQIAQIIFEVDVIENQQQHREYLFQTFPWIPLPFTLCMLVFLKLRGKSRELMIAEEEDRAGSSTDDSYDAITQPPAVGRTDTDTTADETLSVHVYGGGYGRHDSADSDADETSSPETLTTATWRQHVDESGSGHFYYQNLQTGEVTWDAPDWDYGSRILLSNGRIVVISSDPDDEGTVKSYQ